MSKTPVGAVNGDIDEDFYGSDGYNDDDIDEEGFDIGGLSDMSSIDDLY